MFAFLLLAHDLGFWVQVSLVPIGAAVAVGMSIYCSRDWRWYATPFPIARRPAGNVYTAHAWFKTIEIHRVKIILAEAGIYFGCGISPFYRPFLVPWKNVWEVEKKHGITNDFTHLEITIEYDMEKIVLSLPLAAEQDLLRYHKGPSFEK